MKIHNVPVRRVHTTFLEGLEINEDEHDFRDQIISIGRHIYASVQQFFQLHGISYSPTGAVEKKLRQLHKSVELKKNELITEYGERGIIIGLSPSYHRSERLRQIQTPGETDQEAAADNFHSIHTPCKCRKCKKH